MMKTKQSVRLAAIAATTSVATTLLTASVATAQERVDSSRTSMSVRPINENDIMMKKTLWRRIDLKEKQNQSMFSKNNEISKYLMEAAKAGIIKAYANDSLTTEITPEKIHERLLIPNTGGGLSAEEIAAGFKEEGTGSGTNNDGWGAPTKETKQTDDGWGAPAPKKKAAAPAPEPVDDGWGPKPKKKATATAKNAKGKKPVQKPVVDTVKTDTAVAAKTFSGDTFFAKEVSLLELKEDWIFDRKRSRLYYDIQSVGLVLPADKNPAGYEVPVAYFRWKDLDQLFRSDPKKFIWYNPQNQAQHKNLADAFDLRLFYGRIYKVANPEDRDLVGMYGNDPKQGLLKSLQIEQELMETEHSLWEY